MKKNLLFLLLAGIILAACGGDDGDSTSTVPSVPEVIKPTANVSLVATLNVSPAKIYNGQTVKLSLADVKGLEILCTEGYKGDADYSFEVEYFLDEKTIGKSSDIAGGFAIEYEVTEKALSEHTLSVKCNGGPKVNTTNAVKSVPFNVENNPVKVSMNFVNHISKDLLSFVTPVIEYTDCLGKHSLTLTKDMYEESSITENDYTYVSYQLKRGIDLNVEPTELSTITMKYIPIENAVADTSKKYYLHNSFRNAGHSYFYKGALHIDNSMSLDMTIDIKIQIGGSGGSANDHLTDGSKVAEYVKQLCATTSTLNVVLGEDGKLTVEKAE